MAADREAGGSARREHGRRKENREQRVRDKHPRIGGAILALGGTPSHERAWKRGAQGEERVAEILGKRLHDDARMLHDRRLPGSRANIDHIVVASSGVWVIDTKRHRGKVDVDKPLFGQPKLRVRGHDRTPLVNGVLRQVALVTAVAADLAPGAPVHGVLCFVDAEIPLLGALRVRNLQVLAPKRLAKAVNERGPVCAAAIEALWQGVAYGFPPA